MSDSTIVSLNSGPPAASRSPRSSGASREVVPDAAHQHGEEHRGEEHRGIRQVEETVDSRQPTWTVVSLLAYSRL